MRFLRLAVLAGVLLSACNPEAAATATTIPTVQTSSAAATRVQPNATSLPTLVATSTVNTATAEVAKLSATNMPSPLAAATNMPSPSTPSEPATTAPSADQPFDVAAQAAALLPEFQSDLDRAGEWNRYTLRGTLDPTQRRFTASLRVEYTNRDTAPLDKVYFHLYPNLSDFGGKLDVSNLSVDGQATIPIFELRRYLLRVNLPKPLAVGATTVIRMQFQTQAPQNASRNLYGAFNEENGVLALASSFPILAIVRDGAWDIARPDPKGDFVNSETALFDVTLGGPADWKFVTTGVAVDYQTSNGGQTTRFVSGPQRDFTIAAVQLQEATAEVEGTRVTSYFRGGSAQGGKIALDAAVNSVRAYNKRYGRYPMRELDVIEINARQFLGVEYPGLTMIEHNLYTNPRGLETTVAHEVGHMWFYSMVGNDVQRESWLDEAFASYSQIVYGEEVFGPERAAQELQEFRNRYRNNLAAGRDAPVAQDNHKFRGNYVSLVYGKAVLFLQALRNTLGEQGFDRFLHEYYNQHRYGYVTGNDLVATADGVCSCQVDTLYSDWILKAVPVDVP